MQQYLANPPPATQDGLDTLTARWRATRARVTEEQAALIRLRAAGVDPRDPRDVAGFLAFLRVLTLEYRDRTGLAPRTRRAGLALVRELARAVAVVADATL